MIVGDLSTSLSQIDRSSRKMISIKTSELLNTLDKINMADIYRVFHPKTGQYTFHSAAHGTFSKTGHNLGHKASLNKFKKIKLTLCIISDHNGIKVDLNNKRNSRNYSNTWRLNNTLLKNQWATEVIREEIEKFLEGNKNENITYKTLWEHQRPC
jgi:hypothetical protein